MTEEQYVEIPDRDRWNTVMHNTLVLWSTMEVTEKEGLAFCTVMKTQLEERTGLKMEVIMVDKGPEQ